MSAVLGMFAAVFGTMAAGMAPAVLSIYFSERAAKRRADR
jgi:hypothetical protein